MHTGDGTSSTEPIGERWPALVREPPFWSILNITMLCES